MIMNAVLSTLKAFVVILIVIGIGAFGVIYYPWLFGKKIDGEIIEVERVTMPNAVIGKVDKFQMHSYAVLIQDKKGEMYTSSSEDRRWEVAKKGMCVITLFYRHPPWQLQSAGAFFNARVQKIYRCPNKKYNDTQDAVDNSQQHVVPETPGREILFEKE